VALDGARRARGWQPDELAAELEEGRWASDDAVGLGVVVDGEPSGFALVTDLDRAAAEIQMRILPAVRGRGVGREVLRQLADHHFAATRPCTG
jgi:RimJ/RimL family protein N-acetyltransferase